MGRAWRALPEQNYLQSMIRNLPEGGKWPRAVSMMNLADSRLFRKVQRQHGNLPCLFCFNQSSQRSTTAEAMKSHAQRYESASQRDCNRTLLWEVADDSRLRILHYYNPTCLLIAFGR